MNTQYVKSVQQWLVDIKLLSVAKPEWTAEALNALAGAAMIDSAVDPTNPTILRHAPANYKFIGSELIKIEEELVEPSNDVQPKHSKKFKKK